MITLLHNHFTNIQHSDANKIRNTFKYYSNLVFGNINTSVDGSTGDSNYPPLLHTAIFWLFNNIDLTKSYSSSSYMSIGNKCYNEMKKICISCYQIIVNEDGANNFFNLIEELQKDISLISYSSILNYLGEFYNDVYANHNETEQKQLKLYINICISLKKVLTGTTLSIPNEEYLYEANIITHINNAFSRITGRTIQSLAVEEWIHVFN
jgi:hypothetical protein